MKGLDRYITSEPNDRSDSWREDIQANKLSDEFYIENEDWILEYNGIFNKWLNKLFDKDKSPQNAADIIQRAHSIFIKK